MADALATATSLISSPELRPIALARVLTSKNYGGSTRFRPTSPSVRITSRISRDSCETQPFSESLEWRGRGTGEGGGRLCGGRAARVFPPWVAVGGGRGVPLLPD